ncbi:MAG TPA: NAD(P)/FAD-dependent oxidoreductase [Verrucomicrobiae bacterium]|nr:NAD(P)/FAD-dependent oxidoreductase [Verrucomicrobiae bacterium]
MSARIGIVGGGAAGFFAAISCAETFPRARVTLFEKTSQFLSKVRISGGGRCNVTHACFEPRELSGYYPRGGPALVGPFHTFQPLDTIAWFESRGVKLKTEADGRVFPVTDSSATIIDCLLDAARSARVELKPNRAPQRVARCSQNGFELDFGEGETFRCERLMLATGGCRAAAAGQLAVSLGHTLEPPVPSLFTFHIGAPWLRELAGISVSQAEASLPRFKRREVGPVLITHSGLSGPAILRLSAWCARALHDRNYQVPMCLNWLPDLDAQSLAQKLETMRAAQPSRLVVNTPVPPLPARLWQNLVLVAGIARDTRWAGLSHSARHRLVQQLQSTELQVIGKTLNQDEFVTCGGVRLNEVNFRTMESRICPGLCLGGELLDIDGLTGGFNFQAAWTTGWVAGQAIGADLA